MFRHKKSLKPKDCPKQCGKVKDFVFGHFVWLEKILLIKTDIISTENVFSDIGKSTCCGSDLNISF